MQPIPASIFDGGIEEGVAPLEVGGPIAGHPLVSCLMVTRGRLSPSKYAVSCFQAQTYPNRELVVVVDAPACELRAHLASLGDDRIRVVEAPPGTTLGELRNTSISAARGAYVCQWDDDDLYAPERIQTQLSALLAARASACVLRRWTLWWPEADRLAVSGVRLWEGSILAVKEALPPYPALRRGEDTEMMEALLQRGRVLSLEAPQLYVYIHHGGNTFSERHFFYIYNFSRQRWIGPAYHEKLAGLAQTLPIREYRQTLPAPVKPVDAPGTGAALVSIIVRSMGRPELRLALESLAAQDYPALEIIVVDATGGTHPPLPDIAWRPGHRVRMVGGDRRLLRPHAANAGLDAVRGEWFGFLDDDDSYDPDHVSTLMKAALVTDKLVVYGMTRMLDASGETVSLAGLPFNRAIMFHGPILYPQTALVRRKVLELGCRFDERFEISEDRDFFFQIAEYSDFEYIPHVSFNYGLELGTSGTGRGGNRDEARVVRFEHLLRSKWLGPGVYHTARTVRACQNAIAAYVRGDVTEARAVLVQVLRNYPDDANALNGLGYIALNGGELNEAERLLRRAIEVNPTFAEARFHLATTLERSGRSWEAREEARRAVSDPGVREMVLQLLARLGNPPPRRQPTSPVRAAAATSPSRMAPCPCGSGKRYKQCCGQLAAPGAGDSPAEAAAQGAIAAFRSGEARTAIDVLVRISPAVLARAEMALACGDICTEMARYEEAYGFFRRAAALGEAARAGQGVTVACQHWFKPVRDASVRRTVGMLAGRLNRSAPDGRAGQDPEIHIIADLDRVGGSEHRALNLCRRLMRHAPVRMWSTVPPLAYFGERFPVDTIDVPGGRYPRSGHLVFVSTYFEYGAWLKSCKADRITICYNIDEPASLIERLVELEDLPGPVSLDFVFPSARFRDAVGLAGQVEYALPDLDHFRPAPARTGKPGPLVIGRHSRDHRLKFHPNDPAFFRQLTRLGHTVRITGGTCLAGALGDGKMAGSIALLPETPSGVAEFLGGLDCFVYRIHPHLFETGGTVILEAMAMSLPVVLFGEQVGVAELIDQGQNGFLVDTEDEALACIARLAADPELRRAIGAAARATVVRLLEAQSRSMLDFYLEGEAAHSGASLSLHP